MRPRVAITAFRGQKGEHHARPSLPIMVHHATHMRGPPRDNLSGAPAQAVGQPRSIATSWSSTDLPDAPGRPPRSAPSIRRAALVRLANSSG